MHLLKKLVHCIKLMNDKHLKTNYSWNLKSMNHLSLQVHTGQQIVIIKNIMFAVLCYALFRNVKIKNYAIVDSWCWCLLKAFTVYSTYWIEIENIQSTMNIIWLIIVDVFALANIELVPYINSYHRPYFIIVFLEYSFEMRYQYCM